MPKIPVYSSSVKIQTGGNIPQVSPQEHGERAVIQATKDFEQTFTLIRDFRQSAEASAFGLERLNNTLNLWERDTENLDPTSYYAELDKIGAEASKNISGQLAKERFMFDFNKQVEAAKFKINDSYRKKEINALAGTLEYQAQQIIDNPPDDLQDPLHDKTLMNYRQQYEKAIQLGLYTRGEANYKYNEFLKASRESKVRNDISNDVAVEEKNSLVLQELRKGEDGEYGQLPKARITELIDASISKIAENEKAVKKAVEDDAIFTLGQQLTNQGDFDTRLEQGIPIQEALKELDNAIYSERFNPEWAKARKKAILYNGGINKKMMEEYENNLIMRISALDSGYALLSKGEKKNFKKARDYLKEVQSIAVDIENGKAQGLLGDTSDMEKNLYNKNTLQATKSAVSKGKPWHYNIVDADEAFKEVMETADRYSAVREFFYQTEGKNLNSEAQQEITAKIIRDAQVKNYPKYSQYEVGQIINTPKGTVKVTGIDKDGMPIIEIVKAKEEVK